MEDMAGFHWVVAVLYLGRLDDPGAEGMEINGSTVATSTT